MNNIIFFLLIVQILLCNIYAYYDFIYSNGTKNRTYKERFFEIFIEALNQSYSYFNISYGCKHLIASEYLNLNILNGKPFYSYEKDIRTMYFMKLFDDTGKAKNDLSTYDQCMSKVYRVLSKRDDKKLNITFVVVETDKTKNSSIIHSGSPNVTYTKNSSDYDNAFYIYGFCLPQGRMNINYTINVNGTNMYRYCSDEDYKYFLMELNNLTSGLLEIINYDVNVFSIRKYPMKEEDPLNGVSLKMIPFYIVLIHIIFIIIKESIKKIVVKCFKSSDTSSKSNELLSKNTQSEYTESEDKELENEESNKRKIWKKVNVPLIIKAIFDSFNFTENIKELFNFSFSSTKLNNDSGIYYVRGIKSLSVVFMILGLTFFALFNSYEKVFGLAGFLSLNKNMLFWLISVGLRIAPRVIFSCSGFTFSFKYLCYINNNLSFCKIIKFMYYQIHKYLLLILNLFILRYSIYPLFVILSSDTPMWKYYNRRLLSQPKNILDFFLSFTTITSFFLNDKKNKKCMQNIIDYMWIPFNEIFFFIFGVIFLSFGYKCKIRIDIILIIIIPIMFALKVVFSYFIRSNTVKDDIYYSTLYYYFFDYGKFMTNPAFNLPYFLIGFYFGLMNYSVQKRISNRGSISHNLYNVINNKDTNSNKDNEEDERKIEIDGGKDNIENKDDKDNIDNINDKDSIDSIDNNNLIVKKNNVDNTDSNNDKESNEDKNSKFNDYLNKIKLNQNKPESFDNPEDNKEINDKPFLKLPVKNVDFLKHNHKSCLMYFILIIYSLIIISFLVLPYILLPKIDKIKDEINKEEDETKRENMIKEFYEKLYMKDFIPNVVINAVYRIDIEIIVFYIQFGFFFYYIKGQNFINDFFSHLFWAVFNKLYFSLIIVVNPVILFLFYHSETLILLNIYNIFLYSLISSFLVIVLSIIIYLTFELPYKRLNKQLIDSQPSYEITIEEDNEEEIKEEIIDDNDDFEHSEASDKKIISCDEISNSDN